MLERVTYAVDGDLPELPELPAASVATTEIGIRVVVLGNGSGPSVPVNTFRAVELIGTVDVVPLNVYWKWTSRAAGPLRSSVTVTLIVLVRAPYWQPSDSIDVGPAPAEPTVGAVVSDGALAEAEAETEAEGELDAEVAGDLLGVPAGLFEAAGVEVVPAAEGDAGGTTGVADSLGAGSATAGPAAPLVMVTCSSAAAY